MKKILLIDGNSILNRAFYALPDLTTSDGRHTGAVIGFLNIMQKFLDEENPTHILVAFDLKAPTFRHQMYAEYKGTRKGMPVELLEQVPLIKQVLNTMGIKILEKSGYEADDILGTISREAEKLGYIVCIVSGDRDLLQLATSTIQIRIPKTKGKTTIVEDYYEADVIEKYGITPTEFIDLKGLMGDTSDNIPGVPGIGEKTATAIIKEFKSIENAKQNLDSIKPKKARENLAKFYDQAIFSKQLATIKLDCDLNCDLEECSVVNFYNENSFPLFKELEFKSFFGRFDKDSIKDKEFKLEIIEIEDLLNAQEVFNKAHKEKIVGLSIAVSNNSFVGVSLAIKDEVFYITMGGFLTREVLVQMIEEMYKSNIMIVSFNIKNILYYINIDNNRKNIFDVELASYLINPLKGSYEYSEIAREYLKQIMPSKAELLGKLDFLENLKIDKRKTLESVCNESYIALKVYDILNNKLDELNMKDLFLNIEMPTLFVLFDMEKRGIKVEKEALKEYGENIKQALIEKEEEIYKLAGKEFNINSPKQLGIILFEDLKIPNGKKTKTGYSTNVDVLENLRNDYKIVDEVLIYRHLAKLKSTYVDGLANFIGKDGKIHSTFNQTITATGRLSSTDPNLQNIPIREQLGREIRKVFVPEDGFVFVDADYSQIELRILAHISDDENLINAYNQNLDIHTATASEVFDIPIDEVTKDKRREAKAVNFGIVYGISAFGLSKDLNISRERASEYIDKYFKTYPKIKKFLDNIVEEAKAKGYVYTLFNRLRPIPELKSSNFLQRNFGERIAMNSPIQGTAADIIKIAMIRVNNRLKAENLKSRLILQVHDELLIEAHNTEVEKVKNILIEEMTGVAKLSVELLVDVNKGVNWYAMLPY